MSATVAGITREAHSATMIQPISLNTTDRVQNRADIVLNRVTGGSRRVSGGKGRPADWWETLAREIYPQQTPLAESTPPHGQHHFRHFAKFKDTTPHSLTILKQN